MKILIETKYGNLEAEIDEKKNPKTATNLAKNLSYDDWKYINFTTEVAEYGEVEMKSYPFKVRIILIKKIDAKGEIIFNHLLTSIPKKQYDCVEIFSLYNRREIIETEIKENKNGLSISNLRTKNFYGICMFLYCAFLTFNLFSYFRENILSKTKLSNLGLSEITNKFMDIPGKIKQKNKTTKILLPLYHNYCKLFVKNPSPSFWDTS